MKRIVAIVLLLASLLALCACGKSEAVKNTEKAIEAIGTVDGSSEEKIKEAEKQYGYLTDEEKEKVENRSALFAAREAYDKLRDQKVQENGQKIYQHLEKATELCQSAMEEIDAAWHFGIYDASHAYTDEAGFWFDFAYGIYSAGIMRDTQSEVKKAAKDLGFTHTQVRSDWRKCVQVYLKVLENRGAYDEIDQELAAALELLDELENKYESTPAMEALRSYYEMVEEYRDFVVSPSGSYGDLSSTVATMESRIETAKKSVDKLL